jgi:hypothetical protein
MVRYVWAERDFVTLHQTLPSDWIGTSSAPGIYLGNYQTTVSKYHLIAGFRDPFSPSDNFDYPEFRFSQISFSTPSDLNSTKYYAAEDLNGTALKPYSKWVTFSIPDNLTIPADIPTIGDDRYFSTRADSGAHVFGWLSQGTPFSRDLTNFSSDLAQNALGAAINAQMIEASRLFLGDIATSQIERSLEFGTLYRDLSLKALDVLSYGVHNFDTINAAEFSAKVQRLEAEMAASILPTYASIINNAFSLGPPVNVLKAFGIGEPIGPNWTKIIAEQLLNRLFMSGTNLQLDWSYAGSHTMYSPVVTGKILVDDNMYWRSSGNDFVIAPNGPIDMLSGNDTLVTFSKNDRATLGPGNDLWHGGGGLDQSAYSAIRSSFEVRIDNSGVATVIDKGGSFGTDRLIEVERLQFSDGILALDTGGTAGKVYRLYQAAFARTPDNAGLKHNLALVDEGFSLEQMSYAFLASSEFQQRYGANQTDVEFINALYRNVLGRDADQTGLDGWQARLNDGSWTRTTLLVGFSESPENIALVDTAIGNGIWLF